MTEQADTAAGQPSDNRGELDSGSVSVSGQGLGTNVITPADTKRGLERQLAAYVRKCHTVIFSGSIPDGREKYRALRNLFLKYQNVLDRMARGRNAGSPPKPERDEAVAWARGEIAEGRVRKQIVSWLVTHYGASPRTADRWYKKALRHD